MYEWKCRLFDVFANVFVDGFLLFLADCILKLFLVCFFDSVPFCGLDAWNASAQEIQGFLVFLAFFQELDKNGLTGVCVNGIGNHGVVSFLC